jgi:hypothetical protein
MLFGIIPDDLSRFGIYQFRIYNIIFYSYVVFMLYVSIDNNGENIRSLYINGTIVFLILMIIYYFYKLNYGFTNIVPQMEETPLDKVSIIQNPGSSLKRDPNSGHGFSTYLRINIKPKTFKTYTKIAEKSGQFQIYYDGNTGDLIFKVPTKVEEVTTYDNVFTLKNYPLQRVNHIFMIARQNVLTIYLNDKRYSFLMDYYGSVVNSNIYIGDNDGVSGDVYRFVYFDFPLSDYQVINIYKSLRRENYYLLGFIPYKIIW